MREQDRMKNCRGQCTRSCVNTATIHAARFHRIVRKKKTEVLRGSSVHSSTSCCCFRRQPDSSSLRQARRIWIFVLLDKLRVAARRKTVVHHCTFLLYAEPRQRGIWLRKFWPLAVQHPMSVQMYWRKPLPPLPGRARRNFTAWLRLGSDSVFGGVSILEAPWPYQSSCSLPPPKPSLRPSHPCCWFALTRPAWRRGLVECYDAYQVQGQPTRRSEQRSEKTDFHLVADIFEWSVRGFVAIVFQPSTLASVSRNTHILL